MCEGKSFDFSRMTLQSTGNLKVALKERPGSELLKRVRQCHVT